MKKYIHYSILFFLLTPSFSKGQDIPIYTQYLLNPYLLNPAYSELSLCGILQTTNRLQWIGMPDAPRTFSLSYHQRFASNLSINGFLYKDQNGLNNEAGYQVSAAYQVAFNESLMDIKRISVGLSIQNFNHYVNENQFTPYSGDPAVSGTPQHAIAFNANFGITFIYNHFSAGLSAVNLLQTNYVNYNKEKYSYNLRNYILNTQYTFTIHDQFLLEPSLVFKTTESFNTQLDLNLKPIFKIDYYRFWGGVSYRQMFDKTGQQNTSFILFAGFESGSIRLGYAYDFGLSGIKDYHNGSHDIMLAYKFCHMKKRGGKPLQMHRNTRMLGYSN